MKYVVLGAGRCGVAIAYDLARHGEADAITLVDKVGSKAQEGAARVRRLVPGVRIEPTTNVSLRDHDVAVSALPYRFNPHLAREAVRERVSFCDLGGNTDLVREELELDAQAKTAGVTIVPDCGLAPGLANILAAMAVEEVPGARHVRIFCGGLPTKPKPPIGYSLLFSIAGLTNEYTGKAAVLRKGKIQHVEAFTECEPFRGPAKLGAMEAFVTSGGSSTAPWTFQGRLQTYEYKTVRYRGHFEKVRAMIDLGLLDLEPVDGIVPREVFHAVAGPRLEDPDVKDLAILRVDCRNAKGKGVRFSMLQRHDRRTGFTAMERTTGYPAAVVAHTLALRELEPGAVTPERAGFGADHLDALRKRGIVVERTRL